MDKYEYKIRSDEIKMLIEKGDYVQAAEIADTIDWRRVKSVMMLCTISDLYKINRRYEDAKNMLLLAYERRPGGRTICYSLCELCIKTGDLVPALKYLNEFVQVAPKDPGRYILQYKLYEAQEVSLEERIGVLEELKKRDYREKWAYELAYLYHRIGLATRCVEECDELILWFGEGKYVVKAMELKMLHQPLTPAQQEVYDRRFDTYVRQEDTSEQTEEEVFDDAVLQEAPDGEWPEAEDNGAPAADGQKELDIQVKTVDVGKYNTINLQAELAAGLQEVLGTNDAARAVALNSIYLPEEQEERGFVANDRIPEAEEMETEVFFGTTGEMEEMPQEEFYSEHLEEEVSQEETVEEISQDVIINRGTAVQAEPDETPAMQPGWNKVSVAPPELVEVPAAPPEHEMRTEDSPAGQAENGQENQRGSSPADTAVVDSMQVLQEERGANTDKKDKATSGELADVLSLEASGQISIVLPENAPVEKQITGQMKIEDILTEWEQMKKESEEKCREEVRERVLRHTGPMFTEFEASARDGLLEHLEHDAPSGNMDFEAGTKVEKPMNTLTEMETEFPSEEPSDGEHAVEEPESAAEVETAQVESVSKDFEEYAEAEELYRDAAAEEAEAMNGDVEDAGAMLVSEDFGELNAEEEQYAGEMEEADEWREETEFLQGENISGNDIIEEIEEIQEQIEKEERPRSSDENLEIYDRPVIERDREKSRSLTREEKELFSPFIQNRRSREQLMKALDSISMAAYTGNVIITGEEGMDTLALAQNMMREVKMTDSNFSGRTARITGQGLNRRSVSEILEQMNNGALIIEAASGMSVATAVALHRALQQERLGIIVILVDTKKALEKLFRGAPDLRSDFTARMDLEALSNDSLVSFGRQYAREMEYAIDDLGMLALHTRIEEMQTIDHAVTVMEVKQIVDEAIHHASRKTLGHFFDVLLARRYDDDDMIVLTEKDFVA